MPAFLSGFPIRRRRLRVYALVTSTIFTLVYFFHGPNESFATGTLDEGQLARFMNRLSNSKQHKIASSFDWLTSPKKFEVESPIPLPTTEPTYIPRIQYQFPPETVEDALIREERRIAVRNTFRKSWKNYRESAWMQDEYKPISNEGKNNWGGWAATLIDSLDTLWIMGLRDEFQEAVGAVATIDFGNCTEVNISVFETTIRYLGGLIGAYDLSGEDILLKQAVQVGEMLLHAFDTENGMPVDRLDILQAKTGTGSLPDNHICIAGIGSMTMEFIRLAQITGQDKYYHAVTWITIALNEGQSTSLIPGLFPIWMSPQLISFNDSRAVTFGIGAMADSTFEYFPKTYALLGGVDTVYQKLYLDSAAQIDTHLLFRPMLPNSPDILFAGDLRILNRQDPATTVLDPNMQHLTCFAGGMYALGGKLFNNAHHLRLAAQLTDGCMYAYAAMPSGVMPEIFESVPCADRASCPWNQTTWETAVVRHFGPRYSFDAQRAVTDQRLPAGFASIRDSRYLLRPEAIESVFVMHRVTGQKKYREAAWSMFSAIEAATATEFGNAALADVTMGAGGELVDSMETFWLAETLKYFYLTFSPPDLISLDEWVLNTEAHPFRRPR